MKIRRLILTALLLICLTPGTALAAEQAGAAAPDAAETYDMERAVNRALQSNPRMEAIRRAFLGSEFGILSARGDFGPELSTSYSYTYVNQDASATSLDDRWDWSVNVHQDLFTGYRILSTYEKSVLSKEQTSAKLDQTELTLIQTVQENFLGLLKAREDVRSAQDQVARLTEQLKVTSAFYEVGLQPRLDVLQAEARQAQAENDLVVAKNQVQTQLARLNTLLNIPLDSKAEYVGKLEYMPFIIPIGECLSRAYTKRPDMEIASKSVEIATKDKSITESTFWPQIGADLTWQTWGDDFTATGAFEQPNDYSSWSAGVSATWKFFECGKTYYASKQADERIKELISEADNTRQEATFEVKSNHLNIEAATERIQVARKALAAARESYRMAQARYQAQVGTNIDVLDAQAQVTQSEASLIQALADYQIAVSRLFVSMGDKNPGLAY